MEGMEASRSDPDPQSVAQQDGQRDKETAGQSGSLHHASPVHRPRDSRHRMLAVRQLLVPGPRQLRGHSGLTNTQTTEHELCAHHPRGGKRIIEHILARIDHRQRLASGRIDERRFHKSVTSDFARRGFLRGGRGRGAGRRRRRGERGPDHRSHELLSTAQTRQSHGR
ncbi:uncharacterized protein LOC123683473 isoform X1 [Harmonia axyridis]|uniref:uncharacterized protein LOC123683473 isoform X1 n=1 Tax=Harmonia axyridis TaxID=115357 RepID=UPI001E279A40|nr:uncharacterized protein LOC123683473 isoform X1 [Harmonia axyridis]